MTRGERHPTTLRVPPVALRESVNGPVWPYLERPGFFDRPCCGDPADCAEPCESVQETES